MQAIVQAFVETTIDVRAIVWAIVDVRRDVCETS